MITHTWYRILPLHSIKCDNLAFAIGQSWDLICPFIVDLGYIYDVQGSIRITVLQFENLQHLNMGGKK